MFIVLFNESKFVCLRMRIKCLTLGIRKKMKENNCYN